MNARDEFYIILSDDLTRKGNKSVLYRFLDEEQERKADKENEANINGVRSFQIRIRFYRKQLKMGEITVEEYLKHFCSVLFQNPKYCKSCGKPEKSFNNSRRIGYCSKNPEPLLKELLDAALGDDWLKNENSITQGIKKLCMILNAKDSAEYRNTVEGLSRGKFLDGNFSKIMLITDAVLDVVIAYDIKEFFYGTAVEALDEYVITKRRKNSDKTISGGRPERIDKSLRLIDFYCRQEGKTLFGTENKDAPGDEECDLLYRKLLASENERVFIPLLVDNVTGCGIYIIGKAYFESEYADDLNQYGKIKKTCAYGVMFFDNDSGEEIRTGYHIYNRIEDFSSYNEVRFSGNWCYEKARQDASDIMKESNGKMPDGMSETFRKYFEAEADLESEILKQEVRKDVSDCEKELRRKEL